VLVFTVQAFASQEPAGRRANPARQTAGSMPKEMAAGCISGRWLDQRVHGKVEVGQNIRTSLAQAVAEELRVPSLGAFDHG